MCYSVIDIEDEINEFECMFTGGGMASMDVFLWRVAQMLAGVRIATKTRNRKISSAIKRIEQAMENIPDSKNKEVLEIIIRDKKGEIKTYESHIENMTLII